MSDFLQISWSCKSRFFPVAIVVLRNRGTMALLWALKNYQNPVLCKISECSSKISVYIFETRSLKKADFFCSNNSKRSFQLISLIDWNLGILTVPIVKPLSCITQPRLQSQPICHGKASIGVQLRLRAHFDQIL